MAVTLDTIGPLKFFLITCLQNMLYLGQRCAVIQM